MQTIEIAMMEGRIRSKIPINRKTSRGEKRETGSGGNDCMIHSFLDWLCSAHGSFHVHFSSAFSPLFYPHYLLDEVFYSKLDIFFWDNKI